MKKMLLATALACTGCAQQTFTVQNKPAVAPKAITIISSFLELGRRKLSMQPKFVAQKMLVGNPANIRKWIARFYYFRHLCTPLEARVYCSQ